MSFTIADFISLLALVVVIWYTWETRRIRIETAENNRLLSDQINDLKKQEITRRRLIAPLFDYKSGGMNHSVGQYELHFANVRSRALSVEIQPPSGITGSISERTDVTTTSEAFQLLKVNLVGELLKNRSTSFGFALKYRDELGTLWKASYLWQQGRAVLEDLSMENEL